MAPIRSSCWRTDVWLSKAPGPSCSRAAAFTRRCARQETSRGEYLQGFGFMSNVGADRKVEGDWCRDPIPPNVEFGEGFYCESAQVFRFLKSKEPRAVR